ncbi:hypothetical protein [Paenibacillus sinopodophylli]|uniref:portal protein n=1 Tax=Paenibacillus sinopodophylli TaxID=1837342 RepID=UPI00110CA2B8|nr:hypothetical protein [Paenibacillus sinopodophylli]
MSVIDKAKEAFAGVFGSSDTAEKEPINTPEQQKLVDMSYNDYQYFKSDRQRVEPMWREEQRFYSGDHWYGLRPPEVSQMRPNSVDNIAWSQIESITAKLCSWMPYPEFEPPEPNDEQKAQELTAYMPYELKSIRFQQKHIRAIRRMVIHGPLIYKVIYDPTVEGGSGMYRFLGQNDIIPVDLGTFFPDPRIRDFIDLQKGAAHIFHFRKPMEYFKQRFPKQGEKVQPDMDEDDVYIYDQEEYSKRGFNSDRTPGDGTSNIKTAGLLEYWYRGKPKLMTKEDKTLFEEMAADKLAEGKDPAEALAKSKGSMNGIHCLYISVGGVFLEHKSYVYDHGQYPVIARTLFPDEDNAWGKGYMRDMMKPQIMLNKFAELAVETTAKQGTAGIMYEPDALLKPEKFRQQRASAGFMMEVNRLDGLKEMQGVNVPQTVFNLLEYYKDMLQKIPGQFDSANGQASSNVKSGEQAKALISAANNRLIVATELIEDALDEVFRQYIYDMAQFYTTERIARVTGKSVKLSRESMIGTVQSEYDTGNKIKDPETGQEKPEVLQVQEEYVPEFDITVKIGVEKPTDREYYIQTAFNLFNLINPLTGLPMIDAKAVQYTVENGRMEPFSIIDERMNTEAQIKQQMDQQNQQIETLTQQLEQTQKQLGQVDEAKQQTDSAKVQTDQFKAETDRMKAEGDYILNAEKATQSQKQSEFGNVMQVAQMQQSNQ